MGYIESSLMKGENVVLKAQLHWAIYWLPALIALLGLCLLVVPLDSISFFTRMVCCLVLFVLAGLWTLVKWGGKMFVLTNKRIIEKSGILQRDSNELVLHKIEGVNLSQSIFGRLMNFGTVIVTTGEVTNEYAYIKGPVKFKMKINEQIDKVKDEN